jgi:hypothetical protein
VALCLIGLGAILGLGAFGYTRLAAAKQAPPTRQTFPVLRGPISATVSSTGQPTSSPPKATSIELARG